MCIKMFCRGFHIVDSGGGSWVGIWDVKEIGLGVGGEIGSGDRINVGKYIKGGIYVRVGDSLGWDVVMGAGAGVNRDIGG